MSKNRGAQNPWEYEAMVIQMTWMMNRGDRHDFTEISPPVMVVSVSSWRASPSHHPFRTMLWYPLNQPSSELGGTPIFRAGHHHDYLPCFPLLPVAFRTCPPVRVSLLSSSVLVSVPCGRSKDMLIFICSNYLSVMMNISISLEWDKYYDQIILEWSNDHISCSNHRSEGDS